MNPETSVSDGSTASYYELPPGATELQHLISHRNMNAQIGEIFRACYRYGEASHSDQLRDAKKILFYAQAEVARLEGGAQKTLHGIQHIKERIRTLSSHTKFQIGDLVKKVKGSQWCGYVVGFYSTELNREGYCVESLAYHGSVQIYPAAALEKIDP